VTRNELAGPRFRRLLPDVYAPAGPSGDLAFRSAAAYLLVGDRGGLLAGYSAALLLGADRAPAHAPAEVLVTRKYRRHPGLVVRYGCVDPGEVVEVAECRVTPAARTASDLARR
jgi:cytosine/adenosine deaminase-related metal-dependent hydrolase